MYVSRCVPQTTAAVLAAGLFEFVGHLGISCRIAGSVQCCCILILNIYCLMLDIPYNGVYLDWCSESSTTVETLEWFKFFLCSELMLLLSSLLLPLLFLIFLLEYGPRRFTLSIELPCTFGGTLHSHSFFAQV